MDSSLAKVISLPEDVSRVMGSARPVPRYWLGVAALLLVLFYSLLWSSHWYPLSDSSLYLHVARGLAAGNDLDWVRTVHRSIRPMTPLMLSWVIRGGGGIGEMHVLMIALTITSQILSFLVLARWFNQRLAFWLSVLTSMSWWVYANAFTIMTEPLFLNFFWGCLLALDHVRDRKSRGAQWTLVILGALLLTGAWFNRVAAILLAPGIMVGLWMSCRRTVPITWRLAWTGLFVLLCVLLWWDYRRPVGEGIATRTDDWMQVPANKDSLSADDDGAALKGEAGYRWRTMVGISNPVLQFPTCWGRWPLETWAAAFVMLFKSKSMVISAIGVLLGILAMIVMITGWVRLAVAGYWWPVALGTYFLPLWFMWGTRVKPRYMIPIAPILFVMLLVGVTWLVCTLLRRANRARVARLALGLMILVSLAANGGAYAVEVYLRRATREDFYDIARRGAMADLVDICAYLRKQTPKDAKVTLNRGASRRIIGVMSQRAVYTVRRESAVKDPTDAKGLTNFFARCETPYVIVLYDASGWPPFHIPKRKKNETWWELWQRNADGKTFSRLSVPRDRSIMDHLVTP